MTLDTRHSGVSFAITIVSALVTASVMLLLR